jgi:serine-type D-Ala-D-Ala carboxypeptidase (penicillin-binding protein 5/6)
VRLRRASACLAAALACALPGALVTASASLAQAPPTRGDAAIVVDARTGEVLHERNPDEVHAIASATKLMTALLTIERASPRDVFVAPAYRASPVESRINLRAGERMTVEDLLEALLLESANDAAVALAHGVSGSRAAFVEEMNARARELGLRGTSFANPIGLDDPANHSTARDLATLARRLLRHRLVARIVDQPRAVLETGVRRRVVANRNRLVRAHPFVNGVKTGHTRRAGYVLVGSASGRGAQVVSVVLREPSEAARDADTLSLLRWGVGQFRRVPVLRRRAELGRTDVRWYDREVALVPARGFALTVRRGERPRTRVDAPAELEGPLRRGARVGTVRVVHRGQTVATVPLVTAEAVPEAGRLRKLRESLGDGLISAALLVMVLLTMLVGLRFRAVRRTRRGGA